VGEVLEQIELREDTRRLLTADGDEGRDATGQQRERLVEGRRSVDERQRRVHHLADGPIDDRGIPKRLVEQALLVDRPDDTDDRVTLGVLRDRDLADAVLLEDRDRLADAAAR